jgi:ABC-type transport system involved in multi-copper enzyme maturation permease subunit
MSKEVTLMSSAKSEWIKFRTVRSTIMGTIVLVFLTIGLGVLVTWLVRAHYNSMPFAQKITFDPVSTSLVGVIFAEFAVGVIGALFITSEYTSGAIRTTLAAVPNRIQLSMSKLLVLVASMLVICEFVCVAAFLVGMAIFSGVVPTRSLGDGTVLRAVLMAGVYLTLLAVFSFALGLILRQSLASISVFVSLLLLVPLIGLAFPQSWQHDFQKFEPINLGGSMMSVVPNTGSFGPGKALVVLVIYVVVLLVIGVTMFQRRDA